MVQSHTTVDDGFGFDEYKFNNKEITFDKPICLGLTTFGSLRTFYA